jgi:hypothetical protein
MTVSSDTTAALADHHPGSILNHFADLPDLRREPGRIHQLDEIVLIATCAVLCGADTWVQSLFRKGERGASAPCLRAPSLTEQGADAPRSPGPVPSGTDSQIADYAHSKIDWLLTSN